MRKISGRFGAMAIVAALMGMMLAAAITSPAQDGVAFRALHSFASTDGVSPYAALLQATDGNLYGTTYQGGLYGSCGGGCGTVFKITPSGTLTTLHDFDGTDGGYPYAGLIQATDGNFYGTTAAYGANGGGTVFRMTPSGTLTTLYDFCSQPNCTDGGTPIAALFEGTGGNLYGTTFYGGANYSACPFQGVTSCGTVFTITPTGTFTTLHSFDGADGANPHAGLVQARDGSLYGTTVNGGASGGVGYGTAFKITPGGALTTLYSFCLQSSCTDGANPYAALLHAADGNLYGTTTGGGVGGLGSGLGTVFKITPKSTLTTQSLTGLAGCGIFSALVQATDGNFYGVASSCGTGTVGTVFEITSRGFSTALHNFDSTDGAYPWGGLVQDTNGNFYGTTAQGGASGSCIGGCGTVFTVSVGLAPFVKTLPTSGKVGALLGILGTNLRGATGATFNGTPATFAVKSSTLITTSVPAGATTGPIQVVTPSGTLTSNVDFRVAP